MGFTRSRSSLVSLSSSVLLLVLAGCTEGGGFPHEGTPAEEDLQGREDNRGDASETVLAIGDPFFDTGDGSIPGVAGRALGVPVRNVSVSGALLVAGLRRRGVGRSVAVLPPCCVGERGAPEAGHRRGGGAW